MKKTFDQYISDQNYYIYFAFGESFSRLRDALCFAACELARQGKLVEVMCLTVPDCACQNCGEMLFDWQSSVGECAGTSGSDTCYFSLSGGLICESCARHEAKLEVREELIHGEEIGAQETMCHLI